MWTHRNTENLNNLQSCMGTTKGSVSKLPEITIACTECTTSPPADHSTIWNTKCAISQSLSNIKESTGVEPDGSELDTLESLNSLQARTPSQVMLASPLRFLGSGSYEWSEGCHAASLLLFVCSGLQDAECWEGSWEYGRPSQHGWFSSLGMPTAHKRRCRSNRSVLEKFCVMEVVQS